MEDGVRVWIIVSGHLCDAVEVEMSDGEFEHGKSPGKETAFEQAKSVSTYAYNHVQTDLQSLGMGR